VIGKGLGIETGWYFAVGISIPLVIWFVATHLKELKGSSSSTSTNIKKEKLQPISG
jgi:hypothetical protein